VLISNRPKSERDRITNCVTTLCEATGRSPTPATFLAYLIGTDGLTVEAVEDATGAALRRPDKWMPTPGELRQLAGDVNPADRAVMAFQALKAACSRVGGYRSPDFDDPLINATVRNLGGWTRACDIPVSEFDLWYRKEFIQVYEMFCRTGATAEQASPLVGETEAMNAANGFTKIEHKERVKVPTGLPWTRSSQARLETSVPQLAIEGA